MSQYAFGSGSLWGTSSASNSTPVKFGAIQEVSVDFSFTTKELHGQYQFPLSIARGAGKITGKAKFGQIFGNAYNSLFFSDTQSTGLILVANDEAATIPATPYTVTVTHAANFETDLGVRFSDGSGALTLVASAPSTGQYSVNISTGVYTFAAADTTKAVLISYTYTATTGGNKTTLANQLMGVAPTFTAVLSETFSGKIVTLRLKSCISSKLTMPFKQEDYMISELDFSCFADASNNVLDLSLSE